MTNSFENPIPDIPEESKLNVCLLNPAWLPEWFWLPVGKLIEANGHNYSIPPLPRGQATRDVNDSLDVIENSMAGLENQVVVSLSRSVEYGVRYLDRLAKQKELNKVLGWIVISSVGPRGYDLSTLKDGHVMPRHTDLHNSGLIVGDHGFETIDRTVAASTMLHDIGDLALKNIVLDNLIKEAPFSKKDTEAVPYLEKNVIPISWYIGANDRVDNTELSVAIATQFFGIDPKYTQWGHVGPLSHTSEVVEVILTEANLARTQGGYTR